MSFDEWWKEQPDDLNKTYPYEALKSLCRNAWDTGYKAGMERAANICLNVKENYDYDRGGFRTMCAYTIRKEIEND